MSIYDLPLIIDDGDPGHEINHEIIHAFLRSTPEFAQSGQFIDYDENLTDVSTSSSSGVAVGPTIVVPPQPTAYFVWFGGFGYNNTAGAAVIFDLILDAGTPSIDSAGDTSPVANGLVYGFKGVWQPAFAGADKTYTCKVRPVGGGIGHALGAANSGGHKFVWPLFAIAN